MSVSFLKPKFYHRDAKMLCLSSPMSSVEQLDLIYASGILLSVCMSDA